jgi:recombinational DNA repair ATPase RecF
MPSIWIRHPSLVEEGPSHQRRWLDWGVFHGRFVSQWTDYRGR